MKINDNKLMKIVTATLLDPLCELFALVRELELLVRESCLDMPNPCNAVKC